VSADGGESAFLVSTNPFDRTWTYSLDTTAYPDGETELLLTITDQSGKAIEKRVLYFFDNTVPIVMVTQPQDYISNEYNGNFIVKGEAADQFGIDQVEYRLVEPNGTVVQDWTETDGTSSWSALFDSREYVSGRGTLHIELRAIDRAGNSSSTVIHYDDVILRNNGQAMTAEALVKVLRGEASSSVDVTVEDLEMIGMDGVPVTFDQSLDAPTFIISNPDEASPVDDNVLSGAPRFTGSVSDDSEGVDPSSIQYRITTDNGATVVRDWTEVSSTSGTGLLVRWSADVFGLADGVHELQIRASDTGTAAGVSPLVAFRVDKGAPSLTTTAPDQGSYQGSTFDIVGTATDPQGVQSVSVSLDNGATWLPATLDSPGGADVIWDIAIDPAARGLSDGPLTVKIEASDGISTGAYNLQVVLDSQNPSGAFSVHRSTGR